MHVDRLWPLAVIGAGPAGVAAASEAARLGFTPLLMDMSGRAGGIISQAFEVRNFPGSAGNARGSEVALLLARQIEAWGLPILKGMALRLSLGDGLIEVRCVGGRIVLAQAAVIATGTRPLIPSIPGLDHERSAACSAEQALASGSPTSAAVVGGSDVAFDQARFLNNRGLATTLLCRSEAPRAPEWLVKAAKAEGVSVRCSTTVLQCGRRGDGFVLVCSNAQSTFDIETDSLLVAAGREPVLPDGVASLLESAPRRIAVAGDAGGASWRYAVSAMGEGCVAARRLLKPEGGLASWS
jgi:thioredoxin reductase